jgi:hypothetical protein
MGRMIFCGSAAIAAFVLAAYDIAHNLMGYALFQTACFFLQAWIFDKSYTKYKKEKK